MESGPWRTPSGVAPVVPFATARELLDAVIDNVARAAEVAIALRARAGEISDRGDAASTYFLDPARVRLLAQPPAPDAELARAAVDGVRRDRALLASLAQATVPLARALEAWRCDDDDRRILLALVAASVSPRVARLLALLGGDPAAPVITVDALGALLAVGDAGGVRIAGRLAARQPIELFGLVQLARPDAPLTRRPIVVAPRVVELALGSRELDASCGATRVPPVTGAAVNAHDRAGLDGHGAGGNGHRDGVTGRAVDAAMLAAIRAVVERGERPVVGVVGIEHDTIGGVATAAAELGYAVLATALSMMMDSRAGAVLREAAVQKAVLAIEVDVPAGLTGGAAVERAAAAVPVVLVCARHTPPRMTMPIVAVPAAAPTTEQLTAMLGHEIPAALPAHALALSRAMAALAARKLPADALVTTMAEQLVPRVISGAAQVAPRSVSRPTARRAKKVADLWLARERPRRLAVLISGAAGAGKLTLAAAIAQALGIQAYLLDPSVALDPALGEAVAAGAAMAILSDLGGEAIRRLRSTSWWARTTGLLVALTTERMDMLDTSAFDATIRLELPDADERAELWTDAFERRHLQVDPQGVRELARFTLTERRIDELMRSDPEPTVAQLVAAIRRDMGVRTS